MENTNKLKQLIVQYHGEVLELLDKITNESKWNVRSNLNNQIKIKLQIIQDLALQL